VSGRGIGRCCQEPKHDDLVDAVEELGAERLLQLRQTFSFIRSHVTASWLGANPTEAERSATVHSWEDMNTTV
jgi:hypothetical protein